MYSCQGFSKNFIEKFLKADNPEPMHSGANDAIMMLSPFIALDSDRWSEAVNVTHDCVEAHHCADWYVNYGLKDGGETPSSLTAPYESLCKERHWDMSSIITLRNAAVLKIQKVMKKQFKEHSILVLMLIQLLQ